MSRSVGCFGFAKIIASDRSINSESPVMGLINGCKSEVATPAKSICTMVVVKCFTAVSWIDGVRSVRVAVEGGAKKGSNTIIACDCDGGLTVSQLSTHFSTPPTSFFSKRRRTSHSLRTDTTVVGQLSLTAMGLLFREMALALKTNPVPPRPC